MVNVFLKFTIAIPFLIILLMRASSRSCVYNRSEMVEYHKSILHKHIKRVSKSLAANFSTCCKTRKVSSTTFLDVCNNSTKVDKARKNFEEDCCSSSKNLTFCCQFKNLYYSGCLLNHYSGKWPNNSSAINELKKEVSLLVRYSNTNLCINATNKGSAGAAKEMAQAAIQVADSLTSNSEGKSTSSQRKSNFRVRRKHNIRNPPDEQDAIRGGADAPVRTRSQTPKRSKRGQQLDHENCRRICKLSETLQSYETRWQEFLTSNDCS